MIEYRAAGNRRILFVDDEGIPRLPDPFVAVVSSDRELDLTVLAIQIHDLAQLGCQEICVIGDRAEVLHDLVDDIVIEAELEVVTTWFETRDRSEGCDYLLGGRCSLTTIGLVSMLTSACDSWSSHTARIYGSWTRRRMISSRETSPAPFPTTLTGFPPHSAPIDVVDEIDARHG